MTPDAPVGWRRPDIILRVRRGAAGVPCMRFRAGHAVEPVSVGKRGAWVVSADGVQNLHVLLRFDGVRVFGMAAHPDDPPRVDGCALGEEWSEIPLPSVLAFGDARIIIDELDDASSGLGGTTLNASRAALGMLEAGRGAYDPTRVTTRILDIEKLWSKARSLPYQGNAADGAGQSSGHAPQPSPGNTTLRADLYSGTSAAWHEPATTPRNRGGERRRKGLLAQFRQASFPKRATFVLLPFALVALLARFGLDSHAAMRQPRSSQASQVRRNPDPSSSAIPQAPAAAASMSTVAGLIAMPSALPGGPAPRSEPSGPGGAKRPAARTLEREAADALAAGDYVQAVRLYEALASASPDRAVYQHASRILKSRVEPGAQR